MEKKKLRSIAELALLAGVSKSTVSRALSGSRQIGEETTARIRAIAKEYDFQPSAAAQRLSLRSSGTIAFVTHPKDHSCCYTVSDLFSLEIMGAIANGLFARGYDLLVVPADPRDVKWADPYLTTGKVDGFVLITSVRKRAHIDHLLKIGAPFIAWGRGDGRYCSVCGDDRTGGRIATDHLLERGRRRIGFIGGPSIETEVEERFGGYSDALDGAGMEIEPDLVEYGDFSDKSGALAAERLLGRTSFDALFVNSDLMAVAAMEYLRRKGIRVPEDVAVVGYDNLSIGAQTVPPLTTVSQNLPLAGQILARDLIGYLKNGAVTNTTVPVELIEREST